MLKSEYNETLSLIKVKFVPTFWHLDLYYLFSTARACRALKAYREMPRISNTVCDRHWSPFWKCLYYIIVLSPRLGFPVFFTTWLTTESSWTPVAFKTFWMKKFIIIVLKFKSFLTLKNLNHRSILQICDMFYSLFLFYWHLILNVSLPYEFREFRS